jgi:hypothetical protein
MGLPVIVDYKTLAITWRLHTAAIDAVWSDGARVAKGGVLWGMPTTEGISGMD